MRPIDADRFEKELRKYADVKLQNGEREKAVNVLNAISVLKQQPTVEEVTGQWVELQQIGDMTIYQVCSKCGYAYDSGHKSFGSIKEDRYYYNYCPYCGSKNIEVE